jgi:SAM-dependent methyltransferase
LSDGGLLRHVGRYYESKLHEFGPTARGVDWASEESQTLRFAQLLKVLDGLEPNGPVRIADVGCGYGALVGFLRTRGVAFDYVGYDVSRDMLATAQTLWGGDDRVRFVPDWDALPEVDVAVASGVFHVRLTYGDEVWRDHVLDALRAIHAKVRYGWAVNFLTIYSDADRMRPDLYYADPGFLFDWCKRQLTKEVALLHDYGLYEFVLISRKVARKENRGQE